MKCSIIEGNTFALDGGAMFGNAPKALWTRWVRVNASNTIPLASRCVLLRETPLGNVLIDAGIGNFFSEKFLERYQVDKDEPTLIENLEKVGCPHTEIDIVFLTHLHFDHIGGLAEKKKDVLSLYFPKARFLVSKVQWERAKNPQPRDRASYIPELLSLLENQGIERLEKQKLEALSPILRCFTSNGHTPGLLGVEFVADQQKYLFPSDLLPGVAWIPDAITMGYDCHSDLICDEKKFLKAKALKENAWIILGHDPDVPMIELLKGPEGIQVIPKA